MEYGIEDLEWNIKRTDFTPKQIIAELRGFLRDAVKEERRRRGEDTSSGVRYRWLKEKYG